MRFFKEQIVVLSVLLIFITISSCKTNRKSQKNLFLSHIPAPVFPKCEHSKDLYNCSKNYVSDLIIESIKKEKLFLKNDTVKIWFFVDSEGKIKVKDKEIVSNNKELLNISLKVLKKMPKVTPAYNYEGKPATSSQSFYVIIINNKVVNKTPDRVY